MKAFALSVVVQTGFFMIKWHRLLYACVAGLPSSSVPFGVVMAAFAGGWNYRLSYARSAAGMGVRER